MSLAGRQMGIGKARISLEAQMGAVHLDEATSAGLCLERLSVLLSCTIDVMGKS